MHNNILMTEINSFGSYDYIQFTIDNEVVDFGVILNMSIIQKSKLPKFISQTDQQILCLINDVLEGNDSSLLLKDNCLRLEGNSGSKILRMLLDTGRCFWKSCHRQPLSSHFASQSEDHWLALVDGIFLDKASSRVIILEALNNSQASQLADYFKNNSDYQLTPIIRVTSLPRTFLHINMCRLEK